MRVIICGSRTWQDHFAIAALIQSLPKDSVVIHGGAPGADELAGAIAEAAELAVEVYPADWEQNGKKAGPIRNRQMLEEGDPDWVVAFRAAGKSPGTDNMIAIAMQAGIPVTVVNERRDDGPNC